MTTTSNAFCLPTYGLAFANGDPVTTPLDEVGYLDHVDPSGAWVRIPIKGRADPRCITPKASSDSLWIFPVSALSKASSCVL